jgi:hypothetical protein
MTRTTPGLAGTGSLGPVTALLIGFIVECAAALLFWSFRLEAGISGAASVMCGVAAYAGCGGFKRSQQHLRPPRLKTAGRGTVRTG